ncbi:MAG: hypothetical protein KDC42_07690 [Ignavibacteriae bacterium]|nr:hypothetical protein [Ignavibacteriota bacterium]
MLEEKNSLEPGKPGKTSLRQFFFVPAGAQKASQFYPDSSGPTIYTWPFGKTSSSGDQALSWNFLTTISVMALNHLR